MEMREYKPLALVFYIDGNGNRSALPLADEQREAFKKKLEEVKMIELDGVVINTYDIKEIRPAYLTSELEKYYYSRTREERALLSRRAREQSKNQKINALDFFAEFWTESAIERMQRILNHAYAPFTPERQSDIEEIMETKKMSPEQKEAVLMRFRNIKEKLSQPK